jgi:hypothetical protein
VYVILTYSNKWSGRAELFYINQVFLFKPSEKRPDLPTTMSSLSLVCGLKQVQMPMVNRVLLLLKMEARELIRATSIRPLRPGGEEREGGLR